MTDPKDRELDRRIQKLPRSIRPERDLWAGIAARIATKAPPERAASDAARRKMAALGAGAVLIAAAAAWMLSPGGHATRDAKSVAQAQPSSVAPTAGSAIAPRGVAEGAMSPDEEAYRTAVRALEKSFAENRPFLSSEAVRRVDLSLAVLDGAIEATQRALAADPESAELKAQLRDEYQQKIDALTDVVDLTTRTS